MLARMYERRLKGYAAIGYLIEEGIQPSAGHRQIGDYFSSGMIGYVIEGKRLAEISVISKAQ